MISQKDQANVWHPYTQHKIAPLPIAITAGKGSYLIDENGQHYLDLISSWWVNLHGHSHPAIAKAIYQQAMQLEHVIFSGFTHAPAVTLAEKILELLPQNFTKIFYSDNGSTAVEMALKMAYQYWRNKGESKRKRFLAFDKGYHGDTFGAMSISRGSGFFNHFEDLFFSVDLFDYPSTWIGDEAYAEKEQSILVAIKDYLDKYADEAAALIIEPLVQGAGGMNMCTPNFLRQLESLMQSYGILVIYDEVMTGFGRTGNYFACNTAQTTPDIICMAKGITGGFLPLAVTACSEEIYQAFLGDTFAAALAHGHSYTANPLGCAAALASLDLLQSSEVQAQLTSITRIHSEQLKLVSELTAITKTRYCGAISAFDLANQADYGSIASSKLAERFIAKGLLLRPLGSTLYFMPPYCITEHELTHAYSLVKNELYGANIC